MSASLPRTRGSSHTRPGRLASAQLAAQVALKKIFALLRRASAKDRLESGKVSPGEI